MGFRNPATTATAKALDTGGPGVPRVRVYEKVIDSGYDVTRQGVVEFDDPQADVAPTITIGAIVSSGGEFEGGGMTVGGGSWDGNDAPALFLGVAPRPAGGWQGAAQIGGHDLFRQRAWSAQRAGNASDSFPAGSYVGMQSFTIAGAPPGDYLILATAVLGTSVASAAGYLRMTANGTSIFDSRHDVTSAVDPTLFLGTLTDYAGGDLTIQTLFYVAAGTGTVTSAGTAISVLYLGPSAP